MKSKTKNPSKNSGKFIISIILYIVASIVAIIGVALLVNNILLFKSTLSQYVAQGYSAETVINELMKSQLLPGIFEPVAVYGGISLLLLSAGKINKKVTKCLTLLTKVEIRNDIFQENILEQNNESEDAGLEVATEGNVVDTQVEETAQQTVIAEEDIKA
ncbi:MAG: hypothetical protein ACREVX_05565 [Clostridium sp.]|uniref:hypothetical protein n=1 Tax=Clostridium sp. TaxID=1506 RepID=UPI003D6D7835